MVSLKSSFFKTYENEIVGYLSDVNKRFLYMCGRKILGAELGVLNILGKCSVFEPSSPFFLLFILRPSLKMLPRLNLNLLCIPGRSWIYDPPA